MGNTNTRYNPVYKEEIKTPKTKLTNIFMVQTYLLVGNTKSIYNMGFK